MSAVRLAAPSAVRRVLLLGAVAAALVLLVAPAARAKNATHLVINPVASGQTLLIGVLVHQAGNTGVRATSGTVTLSIDGGAPQAKAVDGNGVAVFDIGRPSTGQHALAVGYGGNDQFDAAAIDGPLTVDAAAPVFQPDPSGFPDGPADNDPYDPHPQGSDPKPSTRTLRASARVPRKAAKRLRLKVSRRLGSKASTSYLVRLTGRGRTVATGSLRNRTLTLAVRTRNGRVPKLDGTYTMRGVGTPTLRTTRLMLR